MIKNYRKKPVVIEALQWTGKNEEEITSFVSRKYLFIDGVSKELYIKTLEGELKAKINDFIIKGVEGEFYPCNPHTFEATYEEIKEETKKVIKQVTRRKPKFINVGDLIFPINRIDFLEKSGNDQIVFWTVGGEFQRQSFKDEGAREEAWDKIFNMLNGVE